MDKTTISSIEYSQRRCLAEGDVETGPSALVNMPGNGVDPEPTWMMAMSNTANILHHLQAFDFAYAAAQWPHMTEAVCTLHGYPVSNVAQSTHSLGSSRLCHLSVWSSCISDVVSREDCVCLAWPGRLVPRRCEPEPARTHTKYIGRIGVERVLAWSKGEGLGSGCGDDRSCSRDGGATISGVVARRL